MSSHLLPGGSLGSPTPMFSQPPSQAMPEMCFQNAFPGALQAWPLSWSPRGTPLPLSLPAWQTASVPFRTSLTVKLPVSSRGATPDSSHQDSPIPLLAPKMWGRGHHVSRARRQEVHRGRHFKGSRSPSRLGCPGCGDQSKDWEGSRDMR